MEALVGVSLAALTFYDMCKAISHDMILQETRLLGKYGGKRNFGVIDIDEAATAAATDGGDTSRAHLVEL